VDLTLKLLRNYILLIKFWLVNDAVGESTGREILGKLGQEPAANAPSTSGANEPGSARQDDEARLGRETGKASHVQEDCARHQQEPVERATDGRLPEKPVTSAAIKGKDNTIQKKGKDKASPSCLHPYYDFISSFQSQNFCGSC
jgi:hypothetical protein